jgi:neutral ceramidase
MAFGPGKDMFESTSIIARKQYEKAKELFDTAKERLSGPIIFIHQHIDMANFTVDLGNNRRVSTCKAALGFSFAAGTTDGPGVEWVHQGTKQGEAPPLLNLIKNFIKKPSKKMVNCQLPKAILLAIGEMYFPYQWAPNIIPTQMLQIGKIVIAGLPGEFTTMAGRRMRNAIQEKFSAAGETDVRVMLSGLANTYSNYVTTYEEYQVQMYEGGSTLYGPHTLDAYLQQFTYLAGNIVKKNLKIPFGPAFPNLLKKQITLKPPVIFDSAMIGKKFGDVLLNAKPVYRPGDKVQVIFIGANPRNNLKLDSTYLTIERLNHWKSTSKFEIIATDADWETK